MSNVDIPSGALLGLRGIRYTLSLARFREAQSMVTDIAKYDETLNMYFWDDAIPTLRNIEAVLYNGVDYIWKEMAKSSDLKEILGSFGLFRSVMELSNKPVKEIKGLEKRTIQVPKLYLDIYHIKDGQDACFSGKNVLGPITVKVEAVSREFDYNAQKPLGNWYVGMNQLDMEYAFGLTKEQISDVQKGQPIDWNFTISPPAAATKEDISKMVPSISKADRTP